MMRLPSRSTLTDTLYPDTTLVRSPVTVDACAERKHRSDRLLVRGVLGRAGAELVLHGHTHKTLMQSIAGPTGLIPVLGAPSASANTRDATHAAGWNLISVERRMKAEGPRWPVGIEMRALKIGRASGRERMCQNG